MQRQKNDTIRVSIRVRPLLEHEDEEFWKPDLNNNTLKTVSSNEYNYLINTKDNLLSNKEKTLKKVVLESVYSPQIFGFDKIYDKTSNTQSIYKESCKEITKSILSGFNGSILMYGQTTSGKTFTMLGSPENPGILPCVLRDIFNSIKKDKTLINTKVLCSYIEIYNENIHDLLTNSTNLKLVEDSKFGVICSGMKKVLIQNFEDGINLKDYGEENRKYKETLINEYSSRSHSIFQITIESVFKDDKGLEYNKRSYLNLVDLAGSERIHDYDQKSELFTETGHINKSLFVLANVINKLAEGKTGYIPYRDSKLTRLLSQSLGGNALTSIICTISPAALNYYQTLSTLRFATRAKIIKIKAEALINISEKNEIEYYKQEIKRLKKEIDQRKNAGSFNKRFIPEDEFKEILKSNEQLLHELEQYKSLYYKEKDKNEALQNNKSRSNNINENTPSLSYLSGGEENIQKDNISLDSRKFGNDDISYLENIVNKINQSADKTDKIDTPNLSSNSIYNHLANANKQDKQSNFKEQLGKYLQDQPQRTNIDSLNNQYSNIGTSNKYNIHYMEPKPKSLSYKANYFTLDSKDIYDSMILQYNIDYQQSIEDNIKILKKNYDSLLQKMEETLESQKLGLENYFRNKIKETLVLFSEQNPNNTHQGNLPIISITKEHSLKLNELRDCFDNKLKESEKEFYSKLKEITIKLNNK